MNLDSINENIVPVIDESIDESLKNEINNYGLKLKIKKDLK